MTEANAPQANSGFSNKFLPGLVLGLIVGGLAGAFIPPALDRFMGPSAPGGKSTAGTPNPHENRGGAVAPPPAAPVTPPTAPDAKPAEPAPGAPAKPDEKPAAPAPTAPATNPK